MAKKKNKKQESEKIKLDPEILKAAANVEDTIAKASVELQKMAEEMLSIALEVKNEYGDDLDIDALNEMSSSITQIHEDSP